MTTARRAGPFAREDPLALRFDGSASPVLYLAEAAPGSSDGDPVWRIMQIDTTGPITIKWADGNNSFSQIWNNRASLSYS